MTEPQIEQRLKSFCRSLPEKAGKNDQKRPLYASDLEGTLFSDDLKRWNINKFQPNESIIHKKIRETWSGIHNSYMYIGTRDSIFTFHVEDYNLNSIGYLHYGAPKVWYTIAEKDSAEFEELCKKHLNDYIDCNG